MASQAVGSCFNGGSALLKACSAVPFLGPCVQICAECTLARHIRVSVECSKQIELFEALNDYKRIAICRNLVLAALAVAGAVAGLFSVLGALVFGGVMIVCAVIQFKELCYNLEQIGGLINGAVLEGVSPRFFEYAEES